MTAFLAFAAFQAGWFACVLGAGNDLPWLGPAVVTALVILRLAKPAARAREARVVLAAAAIGLVADTVMRLAGIVSFPGATGPAWLLPAWMFALWINFGLVLRPTLGFLAGRPGLAALLGALGGPPAYLGGRAFGALELHPDLLFACALVALEWAVLAPLLVRVAFPRPAAAAAV